MDKLKRFSDALNHNILPPLDCRTSHCDSKLHVGDKRMASLLLVLHEIDQAVAGLEEIPQSSLIELVSGAILACGFADGTEARHAITTVLEAIDRHDPTPENSPSWTNGAHGK
jgi:hypothetical protein